MTKNKCGNCLFSQGGDKIQFENGDVNYQYNCDLKSRENNIVFIECNLDNYVWENQNACKNFEPATSNLRSREDLNKQNNFIRSISCEGYFEVINKL